MRLCNAQRRVNTSPGRAERVFDGWLSPVPVERIVSLL